MSTTALHRRLRREMPWLTPQIAGDDDILSTLLRRPRLQSDEFGKLDDIPPLNRPELVAPPEPLPIQPTPEIPTAPALQMPTLQRRPTVIHSEGRPTPIVFGTDDPEAQIVARRRALEAYQPQRESKKSLALRAGLNLLRGGLIGEGGVADTLLGQGGVFDRRGKDRAWQQQQLGQLDESLGRMRTDRRQEMQDRLLGAQVKRAEAPPVIDPSDLIQIPDPNNPAQDILVPKRPNLAIPVRPKPSAERRPLLRTVTMEDGSTRTSKSEDNGKTWVDIPELRGAPKPDDNISKYKAAEGLLTDLGAQEEAARVAKDQAWQDYQAARQRYPQNADIQPDVIAAKAAVDDAERYYKSFWSKKNEVKAEMERYKPRAAPALRGGDPQVQAYADKFFKGDYAAAEAAIKKQRGQ